MPTKLIIDGDGLLYRCGFAVEKTHYLVEKGGEFLPAASAKEAADIRGNVADDSIRVWSRKTVEPLENALYLVRTVMDKITDKYGGNFDVWLTPSVGNFRDKIAVTHKYKGNREFTNRPKYYKEIADYLVKNFGAKYAVGQEADDELGIGATDFPDAVLVSYDKDLRQVPGRHYDWVNEEEFHVTKKEGTLAFYSQVLSGDATDNIYGLRGIGPVKANKMLAGCSSSRDCWEVVRNAYQGQEGRDQGRKRAIENARLCWVRRKRDEIWEPPT